ncbi:hypothetical protein AB835_02230 [Candidatus Endobugula sertula]|uniref:Uncharacterized protein n=1 Tax=Candidatus Endobugula sertula TaxID=62101 RepID=A0A1D2QT10_9GAMM|nr:hypothetical protein AB835_02230 [Candidatus Endobugula sertula]
MTHYLQYSGLGILFVLSLSACTTTNNDLYHWGHYESLIHTMYNEPGSATPEEQITTLQSDIEAAKGGNKPIPPGLYAHLGFMYSLTGNMASAVDFFNREKELFPESAVVIDRLTKRANNIRNSQ